MKNMITLPDGRKVWPKYPRWREFGLPRKPNRSKLARGKMRLKLNPLYATDRAKMRPSPSPYKSSHAFNRRIDL